MKLVDTVDRGIRGDLDSKRGDEVLLGEAILRQGEGLGAGIDWLRARRSFERCGGHVFELAGDDIDGGGEAG